MPQAQLTGAYRRVAAALAAADLSESYARTICSSTGQLLGNCRDDQIRLCLELAGHRPGCCGHGPDQCRGDTRSSEALARSPPQVRSRDAAGY